MRIRTAAAVVVLLVAPTGCATAGGTAPAESPAPAAASPSLSKAEVTRQCIDAVAAQSADNGSKPEECATLSDGEYVEANLKGLQQHNKAAQEALHRQIEKARESAAAGH